MGEEKSLALSKRDRVGRDGAQIAEGRPGTADELMLNAQDCFRDHGKTAFQKQVVDADDRTGERVFDWGEKRVGVTIGNCSESRIERSAGNRGNGFAEELNGRSFAERATFTLKSDASGFQFCQGVPAARINSQCGLRFGSGNRTAACQTGV